MTERMELNMKRTNVTTAASMRNTVYQEEPRGNDI